MPSMRELFAELFAYVLLFEDRCRQDEFQPSYEQVRGDITALLEKQEAMAKRLGILEQDYQNARFAVVAWADETILRHTSWAHHRQWSNYPLQLEYYSTTRAGEELFERLERLRADQQDIREIYYLCLGLGFSGKYFLGMEDELTLNRIRHDQARHLPYPIEAVEDITRLTAQPYEIPPSPRIPVKPPLTHLLLRGGFAVMIVVPLLLFFIYQFLPPPVKPSPASPSLPPPDLAILIQQWLDRHPDIIACGRISVDKIDVKTGFVNLGGRVVSETRRDELLSGIRSIKGVQQVHDTLQIVPRPFCEVIDLLEPFKQTAQEQKPGLSVRLGGQGPQPAYHVDENLVIEITTPTTVESYVYVDYYNRAGEVYHLFPNPEEVENVFKAGSSYTVGDLQGPQPWLITPPAGQDLITVMALKTPLEFITPTFDPEPVSPYLAKLRQALGQVSAGDVATMFYFITIRDQP